MAMTSSEGMKTSNSKVTAYSQVCFQNVPEIFAVGSDIECSYVMSEELQASSSDWIGLYKVGWRSPKDYVCYKWSTIPTNYVPGKEAFSHITFPASKMPRDDGDFYQFCYVNASGQIRGASSPFQFKQTANDDLIEIEDENGELLVIRTKTAVLEEHLRKASQLHEELKEKIKTLEEEKAVLTLSKKNYKIKYLEKAEESEALKGQIRELTERLTDMQQEAKDLQVHVRSLKDKAEILNQEKQTMEKRLDDNDIYISSLQEKIKTLVNDKDALAGRTKQLEEEKELHEMRNASANTELQFYVNECERLRTRLNEAETLGASLKKELDRLEAELADQRSQCSQQRALSSAEKDCLAGLQESLRNAEDKLEAAETCKKLLNEEVLMWKQAYEKMSSNLEEAKAEADTCKNLLSQAKKEILIKQQEMDELTKTVDEKEKETQVLKESVAELHQQLDNHSSSKQPENSAMFALELAQSILKERLVSLQKKYNELERKHEKTVATSEQLQAGETTHQKEMADMKSRLAMGLQEYQKVFVERNQLQKELEKLKASADKVPSFGDHASVWETDLLRQMEEIQVQLDKRQEKAEKYKRRYSEIKKKYEAAVGQMHQKPAHHAAPKHSETPTPVAKQVSLEAEAIAKSFDPLITSDSRPNLTPPLTPLPAPIQPEILPSAKVAAIKAQSGMMAGRPDEVQADAGREDEVLAANADEEKFVDAVCDPHPCNGDTPSSPAAAVELDHGNATAVIFVCPMCSDVFGNDTPLDEFTVHVNSHFDM